MWAERFSEFVTLLIVVNPLSTLPVFLAFTAGMPPAAQRRTALVANLVALAILIFFIALGGLLLQKLGISLRAFQIAGGLILFLIALDMVRGDLRIPVGAAASSEGGSVAIYPLATPKIAGPASMLTVVVLTDDHRFDVPSLSMTIGVVILVMLINYLVLLMAPRISRWLGESGASVIMRVMGMLLMALAVQTVLSALAAWLGLPRI